MKSDKGFLISYEPEWMTLILCAAALLISIVFAIWTQHRKPKRDTTHKAA